mgnify:CR=1 FL=1
MNFDKLPCDIKRMIFDCNRAEAVERMKVERTKVVYSDIVLNDLLGSFSYLIKDDDGEIIDEHHHHDYRTALLVISRDRDDSFPFYSSEDE